MARREYKGAAVQTTLASGITSGGLSLTLTEYTGWPTGSFTMIIDPGLSSEEKILCTSRSTSAVTITTRGYDDTAAAAHSAGAVCYPAPTAKDFDEANAHIAETTTAHGITLANIVKTTDTGTVTSTMLANDTILNADVNSSAAIAYSKLNLTGAIVSGDLANDTIVNADINTAAAIDWTKIAPSSTVSATELGYLDGVTSAIQTQMDTKLASATAASTYAPLASPALTGVPTAPTAAANTNTTQIATTAYVQTELTDLIGGAPGALDTLNELATALANDASYSTTITTALSTKLPLAGGTMTGAIAMGTNKITGLDTPTASADAATKGYVDGVTVAPSNLTGPITSTGSATAIASQTGTGTKFVVDTSPTLVTPVLGVATATSVNGTTIPTSKTLVVTTDKISALSATTSAELAGVISDETGTGSLVFASSPALAGTPTAPTATVGTNTTQVATTAFVTDKTDGYATTATAAGTTTLTVASYYQQFFTGSTTQTVVMPVTSTLVVGWKVRVVNNSSGVVTVQSSGANTIYAVPAGGDVIFTCILASGTTAASWDYKNYIAATPTAAAVTKITSATFTTVSDTGTTFDAVFDSTYKNYLIVFSNIVGSVANADFNFQLRISGPTTQTSAYYGTRLTGATLSTISNGSAFKLFALQTAAASGEMLLARNASPASFTYTGVERYGLTGILCGGVNDSIAADAALGFILSASSGTISGFVAVYGLAN